MEGWMAGHVGEGSELDVGCSVGGDWKSREVIMGYRYGTGGSGKGTCRSISAAAAGTSSSGRRVKCPPVSMRVERSPMSGVA